MRLFSFASETFIAEAVSDAEGRGVFQTSRTLIRFEELAALNESNGKVGPHRNVDALPTATPTPRPPSQVPAGPGAADSLMPLLLGLGLLLGRKLRRPPSNG